jgi:molybdopterin-guanine dinucleotide biosynthesis protein A
MPTVPGLLFTGGASRRMGVAKAGLRLEGETLAAHAARVLEAVCAPVIEVGPGYTALPAVREEPPGSGPLAALVAGCAALDAHGVAGPVIVLGVDLPFVGPDLLRWLADQPGDASVIPVAREMPQTLCARYGTSAQARAAQLVAEGERALRVLIDGALLVEEEIWLPHADPRAFDDVDTPDEAARAGLEWPK